MNPCKFCGVKDIPCLDFCECAKCKNPLEYEIWKEENSFEYELWLSKNS